MHITSSGLVVWLFALLHVVGAAPAQCSLQSLPGLPLPHLYGFGLCSTSWDPDGAGPAAPVFVVGGQDLAAGSVSGVTVMTWDGSNWQPLGAPGPMTSYVEALVVWNGQLVAGGANAFGPTSVMTWTGSAWTPIGAAFANPVSNLAVWNGDLVAVTHGTWPDFAIHRFDGTTWTTLPAPPTVARVTSIVSHQGLLCVGGANSTFTQGVLERWNGTAWSPSIVASNSIWCLAVRPPLAFGGADTLYVAGNFTSIGGTAASYIAATSGSAGFAWTALGAGLPSFCASLAVRNNGTLAGEVVASTLGVGASGPVYRWASVGFGNPSWSAMGDAYMGSICYHAGSYHGTRLSAGNAACLRWNGSSAWIDVRAAGLDGTVNALTRSGADTIVGGTFTTDGTTTLNGIARWNGATLQPLGLGLAGGAGAHALLTLANGDALAGGEFTTAGGAFSLNLARWNGNAWSTLGLVNGAVLALVQMPNGDVVAGGRFTTAGGVVCARVARWNGTTWSPLGAGFANDVNALAVRSDGVLFAGGAFPGRIAQWNGTAWATLGAGCNGDVFALAVRPNDDIVAVGAFTAAGGLPAARCARWSATGWAAMGAASNDPTAPRAVIALPDGDIVAGRGFHQPSYTKDSGISRWNGASWSDVGVDFDTSDSPVSVSIRAFAVRANGDLVAGGVFDTAGNSVAFRLARLASTCPATAASYGTGCSSAAGLLQITADTLPWIGAAFRTTTTGVAPGSFCLGLIGLTQVSIPLDLLLGEGQPGCSLLTSLDILLALAPGPGNTASSSFAFGNDPSLIGVPFFQQTIPFEFDALGALAAVRGSNALAATIGTL